MVWEIPYTFIAGTKAKANEVNGNFTSIKQFVDQLESNLATAELDINNLETNKADINGSQDEVFQVANAENNKDAVNLETLKAQTANTLDTIKGFIPSKSSSNTISCTAGSCWDSTYTEMITSSTSLSLQDTALSADTTYYIYVCYDKETSTCKLAFSTNGNTPTLPAGYDYFRRIGSFTTDEDNNIDTVTPYTGGGIWVVKTYRNGTSWYRLWSDGWCEQGGRVSAPSTKQEVTLFKPYADANYEVQLTLISSTRVQNDYACCYDITNSSFSIAGVSDKAIYWRTSGYTT